MSGEAATSPSISDAEAEQRVVRRIKWWPDAEDLANPLQRIPCYKDAIMYGMAGGALGGLGMAWFRNHPRLFVDGFFFGFIGASSVSFLMCSRNSQIRKQSEPCAASVMALFCHFSSSSSSSFCLFLLCSFEEDFGFAIKII